MREKKRRDIGFLVLIGFLLLLFILVTIDGVKRDEERKTSPVATEKPKPSRDQSTLAYIVSKDAVKVRLLAPSTAKFPSYAFNRNGISVNRIGDYTYRVRAYVDAQNGFGAMIRSNYTATIQFTGRESYRVLNVKIY